MRDIPQPAFDAPASDWQVFGDALQDAGDPRGELIALGHALDEGRGDASARDAHVRKHWGVLVGDVSPDDVELEWRYSVLRGVTLKIRDGANKLVENVLALPVARELRRVELRGIGTVDLTAAMTALANKAPATCVDFAFVDQRATEAKMLVSRDFEPPDNLVTMGAFAPFWPRAQSMTIEVADADVLLLEGIVAPELRSFALRCLRMCEWEEVGQVPARLGGASWPKLESFELRCVETWVANTPLEIDPYIPVYSGPDYDGDEGGDEGDSEGVDWAPLVPVLSTLAKGPLKRLALTSFESADSMLEAIAVAGVAPTLRELDFSDSAIVDDHVAWMVSHPELFRQLDRLVLESTHISKSSLATLSKLGPKITYSEGSGPMYRYVVGSE